MKSCLTTVKIAYIVSEWNLKLCMTIQHIAISNNGLLKPNRKAETGRILEPTGAYGPAQLGRYLRPSERFGVLLSSQWMFRTTACFFRGTVSFQFVKDFDEKDKAF